MQNLKVMAGARAARLREALAPAFAPAMAFIFLFVIIVVAFAQPARAAAKIDPLPPAASTPSPAPSLVPIITPTPRPKPTPWNQLGNVVTATPEPTADPMINERIRQEVERAFIIDVTPTPPTASKNRTLTAAQASDSAIAAAKASFKGLEITRLNIQKSIDSLRESVNMAIRALDADERYLQLLDAEDTYGTSLEPEVQMELEMYRMMDYKELTSDERRQLISVRDMGYDRFNFNIRKVDYNIEIMRNQLSYAALAQYSGIAKMQAAIALQQEALDLQLQNLKILKVKYEIGTVARIEVENAEISYNKALIEMRKQQRSLTSLLTSFNKLIGENLGTTYQEFDRAKLKPPKSDDPAAKYVASALEKRSEILIAKEELGLAARQRELYETEITNFRTLDDKQDAIQAAEEAEINYELALQDVEASINSAYKQLVALRGLTPYYESQIETAQRNYDRMQTLFGLGMATASSVDQVRMSLTQAKMQLENNLTDIWLQRQKLQIISSIGPGGL